MNPTPHIHEAEVQDEILHCTVHPDRETTLRCNKCGRPMCVQCAVLTPVGYRCRECVKGIQAGYYKATQADYAVIFGVCAGLTAIGAVIVMAINFGILFTLILALPIGGLVAEGALRLTSRRRGRQSATIAVIGTVVGGLIGGLVQAMLQYGAVIASGRASLIDVLTKIVVPNISLWVFIVLAAVAVYGRMKLRT